jgi:hypothetical protein
METFPKGKAWVDDDGIMRLVFEPKCAIDLDDAKAQVAVMQRLAADGPLPCLVDMREIHKTERAARDYYAGPDTAKAASACAMLIGASGIGAAIGNFMIAIHGKKMMPLKLFTTEAEAMEWLRPFAKKKSA